MHDSGWELNQTKYGANLLINQFKMLNQLKWSKETAISLYHGGQFPLKWSKFV